MPEPPKSALESMRIQAQIRANAEEMQDYLRDLKRWEQDASKRDANVLRQKAPRSTVPGVRQSCGTVGVRGSAPPPPRRQPPCTQQTNQPKKSEQKSKKPDAHTYDKGYAKWEKFDVDSALASVEEEGGEASATRAAPVEEQEQEEEREEEEQALVTSRRGDKENGNSGVLLTPATVTAAASQVRVDKSKVVRALPRSEPGKSPEEQEREAGNAHFRKGEFNLAIRCYTRCIGYNSKSVLAFSNRAMTYLKLKEYAHAEQDATIALKIDPTHVKSLQRRACARTNMGMHRAALLDLEYAYELSPSKELQIEIRKAKEMIRACIRRVPRVTVPIKIVSEPALPQNAAEGSTRLQDEEEPRKSHVGAEAAAAAAATEVSGRDDPLIPKGAPGQVLQPPTAARVKGSSPQQPPQPPAAGDKSLGPVRNSYELQKAWRALGSDVAAKASFVSQEHRLSPGGLVRIFASVAVEPDWLADLLLALEAASIGEAGTGLLMGPGKVLEWLRALGRTHRFDMSALLLSKEGKAVVSRLLEQAEQAEVASADQVRALKKVFSV